MRQHAAQLLSAAGIARLLKLEKSTVAKWVKGGKLPAFKTPGGQNRVKPADLIEYLRSRQIHVPPELHRAVQKAEAAPEAAFGLKPGAHFHPDQLLSTNAVSRLVQMDRASVAKWIEGGLLPATRTPGGYHRVKVSDLVALLRQHRMYVPPVLNGELPRAVVVSNDASTAKVATQTLRGAGFHVEHFDSVVDALLYVGAQRLDVLMIDFDGQPMDAGEVVNRLQPKLVPRNVTLLVIGRESAGRMGRWPRAFRINSVLRKPLRDGKSIVTALERQSSSGSAWSKARAGQLPKR